MKRYLHFLNVLLLLLLCISCFCFSVSAEETADSKDTLSQITEAAGTDRLDDLLDSSQQEIMNQWKISPDHPESMSGLSVKDVFSSLFSAAAKAAKAPFSACAACLCILLFCSAAEGFRGGLKLSQSMTQTFSVLAVCATAVIPFSQTVSRTAETLSQCSHFMLLFIPVFAGLLIASGKSLSSAGFQSAAFAAAEAVSFLAGSVIAPFTGAYTALSVCGALTENLKMNEITRSLKSAVNWILGLSMTLFSAILTISGAVANSSDNLARRTVQYFAGSFVPVIGNAISESIASVRGCVDLLKTGTGAFGLAAVIVIIVPVILELVCWKISLLLSSAAAGTLGLTGPGTMLQMLSDGISLITSAAIVCGLAFIVTLSMMLLIGGNG